MNLKEVLNERLDELGITKYELSKRITEKRGGGKVTDVSSLVSKTLDVPDNRRFCNVSEVVEALDGEIVIRWHDIKEKKLSQG